MNGKYIMVMVLLVCLVMWSGSIMAQEKTEESENKFSPFFFSVMGDNRPGSHPERSQRIAQPIMFKKAIQEVNLLGAEFTVIIGDFILGYDSDTELINQEWDEYFKTCQAFKNPYYSVVGNHDVWNKESEKLFKERVGPLYFAFSHKGCRFICLNGEDTDKPNHIYGKQLAWLKQELEELQDVKYIFIFLHKPLWQYNHDGTNWLQDVHPLLAKYKVDTVFAGHDHRYEFSEPRDGVRYIISGGAGAPLGKEPISGGFFHHLWVQVQADEARVAVIKTGSVCPQDVVTHAWIKQVDELSKSIAIDPISAVMGEASEETVKLTPTNSFEKDLTIDFKLTPRKDSGWSCEEVTHQAVLKPGESTEWSFNISFDGQNPFNAPLTKVSCLLGGEKLLENENEMPSVVVRTLSVNKAVGDIAVDGKLDDPVWKGVSGAGQWMNTNRSGWATETTNWLVCYDDQNLYLAFDCREDRMDLLKQTEKNRDWNSLNDDAVVVYLAPFKDNQDRFCFGTNTFGTVLDYNAPGGARDMKWNPQWDVAITKNKSGYIVEVAIPFEILGVKTPVSGTKWGVNAFRMCIPVEFELDGWNLPLGSLSNTAGYGQIVFE